MDDKELLSAIDRLLARPVAFFPVFAQIGGGVTAGVMLSQLWYWSQGRAWDKDGWIWKTFDQWRQETELTQTEVEGARKKLVARGLVNYQRAGCPAKPYYQIKKNAVLKAIVSLDASEIACLPKNVKLDCLKPSDLIDENVETCLSKTGKHNTESSSQISSTTTTELVEVVVDDLIFPTTSATQRDVLAGLVVGLPFDLAQQILDEVSGHISKNLIKKSSVSLCRALVVRANEGKFSFELGVSIAAAREAAKRALVCQKKTKDEFQLDPVSFENGKKILERVRIARANFLHVSAF